MTISRRRFSLERKRELFAERIRRCAKGPNITKKNAQENESRGRLCFERNELEVSFAGNLRLYRGKRLCSLFMELRQRPLQSGCQNLVHVFYQMHLHLAADVFRDFRE